MRKRVKGLVTIILSLLLLLMNVVGNHTLVNAQGNNVIITEREVFLLVPGETSTIKIPIKAVGEIIQTPVVVAEAGNAPLSLSQPRLTMDGFDKPPHVISPYVTQFIEVDVTADETAKIGVYPIDLIITGTSYIMGEPSPVSTTITVNTQILEEKKPAQLS
ncbi:MAG: hypothetical protein GX129_02270, partial [Clostridiales bacterium]|nr:hypothetical protein [Clostridiales bacterium]